MKIRSGDIVRWHGDLCRVGTEIDDDNVAIGQRVVPRSELTFFKRDWVSARVTSWLHMKVEVRSAYLRNELKRHFEHFTEQFISEMPGNLHVFDEVLREIIKLKNAGQEHYSMRTIIEVLRHESAIHANDEHFKINNNIAPPLARLVMLMFPELDGFFAVREAPARSAA